MATELIRLGSYSDERWDVFLSFRGEDTRRTFTSHLSCILKEKRINVFMDDSLQRGEDISSQLKGIIWGSRVSVVIFSRNYAESRWCLQELCEIMECRRNKPPGPGQVVLPVFYNVSPSDVRKQTGLFGKAFAKNEKNKDYARCRDALTEAGSLAGWDITNAANGTEAQILREIASRICNELKNTYLDVAKYPVGLEYWLEEVKKHLSNGRNGVRFIVICGMRGVGKTTLAKAIYNRLFHTFEDRSLLASVGEDSEWSTFDAKSFLANVGEISKQPNGLVSLQEQLLRDILSTEKIKVDNIHRGITVIKNKLRRRKVLVILDDVTHRNQLNALAREREWFVPGSTIVITTADLDSVKEIKADVVYMLEGLNHAESLQLFSLHAFGCCEPPEKEFTNLSKAVVNYCNGLPLALEVLGSFLLGRTMEEWSSALHKLRRIPHGDIQRKLEMSYDALENDNERELFLDIACFFVGSDKDYVLKILDGCGFSAEIGLSILTRRNLVRISRQNRLEMHDLIRDMGKEVVRKESRNPGQRSRLFFPDDILATLQSHLGAGKVEGLALCSSELTEKKLIDKVDAEAFSGMRRLRLLQLNKLHVDGDYGLISKELRWLSWPGFPLNFLPDELYMGSLVALDLQYSKLRATWKNSKFLGNLKVLNLSHSHFLTKTPDFSKLPNLEELIMQDCKELKEVDGSIGHLERLVSVNLRDCKKLKCIPDSICRAKSLRVLDISGCSMINYLPNEFGELASLKEFLADGTPIAKLPLSMANLKKLEKLYLQGFNRLKSSSISALVLSWISKKEAPNENGQPISPFSGLRSLTHLRLIECNLSDGDILDCIGSLVSLTYLDLTGSSFSRLPGSISSLPNLLYVLVPNCPMLESLSDMPSSVLEMDCRNCPNLAEISYSGKWNPDGLVHLRGCKNLSPKCIESLTKVWRPVEHNEPTRLFCIPRSSIPEWFEYQTKGPSLTFQLPPCKLSRIVVSFIMSSARRHRASQLIEPSLILSSVRLNLELHVFPVVPDYLIGDEMGIFSIVPSDMIVGGMEYGGIKVVLDVEPHPDLVIKGLGAHLEEKHQPGGCRLVDLGDGETDRSHGRSSGEFLQEDEPMATTDLSVCQQWHWRIYPGSLTISFDH